MSVVAHREALFSRGTAILAAGSVLFAAGCVVGCGQGDGSTEPTGDTYADGEGDGGGIVLDAGPVQPGDMPAPNVGADGGCPVLAFPSGIQIRTKEDAKMTAEYASISDEGSYPLPKCFIDVDDLYDPAAGTTYDVSVMVGKHFALSELVGTELPYSHKVLVSPTLVQKLDAYRDALGEAVDLSSGYRSPEHQRAVCQSLCGHDSCSGTCAARSRHSWGDAADHGVTPTKKYSDAGCKARFNYVYREGNHVHLDLNPDHAICTVDIL